LIRVNQHARLECALLVLARAHVATKNGAIMISMGIMNASANVIFNLILFRVIGLEGLALSTSCVHAAVAVVFWFRFESRLASLRREGDAAVIAPVAQ